MNIIFYGATREVTGSCYLLQVNDKNILLECGMVQGSHEHERHNNDPFPFDVSELDGVIISHAHLDHSGRLPMLIKEGFHGNIFTHNATVDLCEIMLIDSAYIHEKDAHWENIKRERKGLPLVEPLYTKQQAQTTLQYFKGLSYDKEVEICPGVKLMLRDAGHIIGSAIVELFLCENGVSKKVVFSGDLGHKNAPILRDPYQVKHADLVIMESTYGDRLHRSWEETWQEMGEIIKNAKNGKGNILIPAFTVGRTQEILYEFKQHFDEWQLADWQIFLDSPMGIKATNVYAKHSDVYDRNALNVEQHYKGLFDLPNLHMSETTEYSMKINQINSGAIIIAGSGMCTGGRIKHHFKHNIWRKNAHVCIVGFQARGTLGRSLVDGCKNITLWGEKIQVNAKVHTIGGFSAHADQSGLLAWYQGFENKPPVVLVHGEEEVMEVLAQKLKHQYQVKVVQATYKQNITI